MQLQRGRLIDHVQLRVGNLEASRRFYQASLGVLGIELESHDGYCFADELWFDEGEPRTHVHLAFQAKDRDTVDRFYAAALAAGGKDNGAPGEREYHPDYYAAFVLDPDGNNIEAVFHGAHQRSAESVTLTW